MKSRLKERTSRSNGWGYAKRKQKLKEYIRGWVRYYHLADMKRLLLDTDEWLRRRNTHVHMEGLEECQDKSGKPYQMRYNKNLAYEWGYTRKGYWRIANSPILAMAIGNNKLRLAGYATLMESYREWHPK